jgi:hypothetical protein
LKKCDGGGIYGWLAPPKISPKRLIRSLMMGGTPFELKLKPDSEL